MVTTSAVDSAWHVVRDEPRVISAVGVLAMVVERRCQRCMFRTLFVRPMSHSLKQYPGPRHLLRTISPSYFQLFKALDG